MKHPAPQPPPPTRSRIVRIVLLAILAVLVGAVIWSMQPPNSPARPAPGDAGPASPPASAPASSPVWGKLIGRWVRPGEAYTIEIRAIDPSGRMEASYYNPSPIRVARGEVKQDGGKTTLYVELAGRNYDGSTYRLTYDPATDRMTGIYHQAMMGQKFEVEFERIRE